jgi:hypothetical protein
MVGGFNRTSGTGAAAGEDIYDTIDDYNYINASIVPQTNPWGNVTVVPGSNWTTLAGPCDMTGACVLRDETTGLLWANADTMTRTWENAITYCAGLNTQGYTSGWRLPSQKELLQAYVNGIWGQRRILKLISNYDRFYWSSSSAKTSSNPSNPAIYDGNLSTAWYIMLANGTLANTSKTTYAYVICVR